MADRVKTLKEWTGKSITTIIYDSTVDEFTADGLFEKVGGKRNIAMVGFTTDGDVFGAFYNVAVTEQDEFFYDRNIFAFSFESHGRCMVPQRFMVKEGLKHKALVGFSDDSFGFVQFDVDDVGVAFSLGNEKSNSYCCNMSAGFEGIQNTTLTGNTYRPYYHCTRLFAIQLS